MGRDNDTLDINTSFNPTNKDNANLFAGITNLSIAGGYGADTITIADGATVTGSVGTGGYYYVDDAADTDTADTLTINGTGSITGNVRL